MASISGEKLKERRRGQGLTQEALAQAMGVTRQTVFNWESGRVLPDERTLERLAHALKTVPEALQSEALPTDTAAPPSKPTRRRWLALSAAVLIGTALFLGLSWLLRDDAPLLAIFQTSEAGPLRLTAVSSPATLVEDSAGRPHHWRPAAAFDASTQVSVEQITLVLFGETLNGRVRVKERRVLDTGEVERLWGGACLTAGGRRSLTSYYEYRPGLTGWGVAVLATDANGRAVEARLYVPFERPAE